VPPHSGELREHAAQRHGAAPAHAPPTRHVDDVIGRIEPDAFVLGAGLSYRDGRVEGTTVS